MWVECSGGRAGEDRAHWVEVDEGIYQIHVDRKQMSVNLFPFFFLFLR